VDNFLSILADPNIAFVLFVIGVVGIALEAVHTNLVTGVIGAFALILAFIGFGSLPLNIAGVLLIVLAVGLFVAETQFASHGLLTIAGVVALVLGASLLYTDAPTASGSVAHVDVPLIGVTSGVVAVLMALVSYGAIRTRKMRPPVGMVGTTPEAGVTGIVQAPLAPLGTVYLAGETWSARTPEGIALPRDTPVRLVGFEGLIALVEPVAQQSPSTTRPPAPPLPAERP
jgi:membrane-bound serine protease (ClpP class)